jgi:hypothetical protein
MTSDIAQHSPSTILASVAFFPLERGWPLLGPMPWKREARQLAPASRSNVDGSLDWVTPSRQERRSLPGSIFSTVRTALSPRRRDDRRRRGRGADAAATAAYEQACLHALSAGIAAEDNVTVRLASPQSEHD